MKNKFYTLFFLLIVTGVTLYLPVRLHKSYSTDTKAQPLSVISSTFYNDAYYYFAIADNYSSSGMTSFDGELPTNGYNFLWQNILNVAFSNIDDKQNQLEFVLFLCIFLSLIANIIIFLTVFKVSNSRILSLFAVFPGFFYLLFSLGLGIHYSPWSVINGMESSLNLLVFSIFLMITVAYAQKDMEKKKYFLLSSIILTVLFLCRFDELFLLFSFAVYILVYEKEDRWKKLIWFKLIPFVIFAIYIIYNQLEYGLPVQVSGLVKSSFYPQNLIHLFNGFVSGRSFDYLAGEHLYSRMLPLMIPLIFIPLISRVLKKHFKNSDNNRWNMVLTILTYYVILKSSYILIFVDFWHQGQWYFFNQIVILNFLTAILFSIYLQKLLEKRIFQIGLIVIIIIFIHTYFMSYETHINATGVIERNDISRIDEMIETYIPEGKIIEMDDGIISYSSGNICLSGFGLCIDREGLSALKDGVLLDLAHRRGYRYLASVNYFKSPELIPNKINTISDFVAVPFFALDNENLRKWQFATVVKDTESKLVVVYFDKK